MGGRAAEEVIFGPNKVTPGAANDLEKATDIAQNMVMQYGMSEKVAHQSFTAAKLKSASTETKMLVDSEIKKILEEEYNRARTILSTHRDQLTRLAENLIEYEELSIDEIKVVINGGDISEAKKQRGDNIS